MERTTPDPRTIITPDAFAVAPALLGQPLASPQRRAGAMAVDLVLLALLVNAGSVFLGLVLAGVLVRAAWRRPATGWRGARRWVRAALGTAAALVLFVTVVAGWDAIRSRIDRLRSAEGPEAGTPAAVGTLALGLVELRRAGTQEEAQAAAAKVAARFRSEGVPEEEIREALLDITETGMPDWAPLAVHAALDTAAEVEPGDTVAALLRQIEWLRGRVRELTRELAEAEEPPSLVRMGGELADDLGLGLGWAGLYFSVSLVYWRGRTPGKRLFGVRVVRLDGRPMTWWAAFTRFGGYAASVLTGLLGFAQILWDRNRQGIHDKIAETVVVRG